MELDFISTWKCSIWTCLQWERVQNSSGISQLAYGTIIQLLSNTCKRMCETNLSTLVKKRLKTQNLQEFTQIWRAHFCKILKFSSLAIPNIWMLQFPKCLTKKKTKQNKTNVSIHMNQTWLQLLSLFYDSITETDPHMRNNLVKWVWSPLDKISSFLNSCTPHSTQNPMKPIGLVSSSKTINIFSFK